MVTAAAVAHVNRVPLLLLPGDVFANRLPDPVLQQVEDFGDGTVSVNDCFKPVSRYFDRIARPEQLIPALNRAMVVLTDPADCGPVTLAMCQDTQAEAYDYPDSFFEEKSGPRAASGPTRTSWWKRSIASSALSGTHAPPHAHRSVSPARDIDLPQDTQFTTCMFAWFQGFSARAGHCSPSLLRARSTPPRASRGNPQDIRETRSCLARGSWDR